MGRLVFCGLKRQRRVSFLGLRDKCLPQATETATLLTLSEMWRIALLILSCLLRLGFFFLWDMGFSFLLAAVIDLFISMSADSQVAALNRPADSLFTYFGLANFCWALAAPVAIFSHLGSWAYWPAFAALIGIGFLHLALKARGIRSVYGFSWILSWITLLLPYILSAVFLVCLSFLAVGSFLLR